MPWDASRKPSGKLCLHRCRSACWRLAGGNTQARAVGDQSGHCVSLVHRSNDAYRNSQLNVGDIDALLMSCFVTAEHQRCSTMMVSLTLSDVLFKFKGLGRFQGRVEPSTEERGEHRGGEGRIQVKNRCDVSQA